jgi:predicted nucleic acid-binding protein
MPGSFFDSNILLYLASDPAKAARARALLLEGGTISVQVLNEVASVSLGKMRRSWQETEELLALLKSLLDVVALGVADHERGLQLAKRYRTSIYDAMIMASALNAGCDTLYTEDLQGGLLIEGRLQVVNPFD